jgi:hypothetical protein
MLVTGEFISAAQVFDQRRQVALNCLEQDGVLNPIVAMDDAIAQSDRQGHFGNALAQDRLFVYRSPAASPRISSWRSTAERTSASAA